MKNTTTASKGIMAMLLIGFLSFFGGKAYASHDMGGFISYTHVSGNTYHVTVTFFRDCSGISAPTNIVINAASASCGFAATTTNLNLTGSINSSPICPSQLLNTTCNGGALPGEEMYIYEADITLAGTCSDWIFSYTDCCLPGTVQNVALNGMYFESTLDNLNISDNNSPVLTSPSMGYICTGLTSTYNFGAVDLDGDSLSYALVTALDAGPIAMTYNAPYSGTNPMASAPAVSMDPITGDLVFNPTMIMGAVIAIRIYEYRDGVLIASHFRQMIVQAISCTNNQPNFAAMFNVTGGVQTGPFALSVCPGTPVTFQITATDVDALNLLALTAVSTYPGATFTQTGTNPATGTFSWTPGLNFIGTNIVVLSAADDNCPYKGNDYQSVMFNVTQTTDAGLDVIHCPAQGPVTLNAIGGTLFTWSVVSGDPVMSCTSCTSTIVSPTVTTTYQVNSNLATCNNNDQVTVTVVPDFTFTVTPDASYCLPYFGTTPVSITATPSPAGSYTYSWDEVGTAPWTSGIQSPTYTASQAANLAVVVSSAAGCVLSDTVSITTTTYDDSPDWSLESSAIDPCMIAPVDLTATVAYGAACDQYAVSSIPFAPESTAGTTVGLSDDVLSGVLPIGFSFNFYCNNYTDFQISSNGFITFDLASFNSGCCTGGIIPTFDGMDNIISLAWNDLNPGAGGNVTYQTIGVAPNRKLVVSYNSVPHFGGGATPIIGQIVLNETTNIIDIHSTNVSNDGSNQTQGIENAIGTVGLSSPGMNSTLATLTNQSYRFSNAGNEPYLLTWEQPLGAPIGTSNPITVTPPTSTTYYAVLTDVTGTCVSGTQSITVSPNTDIIAPVPNLASLSDVTAACSVTTLTSPTALDNCSGTVTGTTTTTLPITATGMTVVNWTFTDGTGNTSSQSQNVIISDVTPPVPTLGSLSAINAECSVTTLTSPTALDNCSGTVTGTTTTILPITATGTTVVNWTFTDLAGNSSTQSQNVVINDLTPPAPTLGSLSAINAECSVTSLTPPTATDNCSGTVTGTTTTILPITATGTTVVNWTFTDVAGNSSTQSQNVVINDLTAPVPNTASLASVTAACSVTTLTAPTATDNCAGTVVATTAAIFPITTQGTTVITWLYNDGNGNTSSQTQNVNINDVTGPTPDLASLTDVTGSCSVTSLISPTATDNCSGTVTVTNNATFPIITSGTTVVTWTYSDILGNTTTQNQNVIISDIVPPVAPILSDVTGSCSVSVSVPTTTDNCNGLITGTTTDPTTYSLQGNYVVTWNFTDLNGNNSTSTQNVTVSGSTTYATLNPNVCGNYTAPSGAIYSFSGTYTDIIPNALGCDSVITINLTANSGIFSNMTASYCQEYTVPSGSMTYYTSGIYNDTLQSIAGCDSVLIIDVTIFQIDSTVSQNGYTLTANATSSEYQWFNCNTGVDVPNGTSQSFTPIYNGAYAVVVLQNGCYDTSICYTFNSADLLNEEDFRALLVYPNPSNGIFTLEGENLADVTAGIYDINGRLIAEMKLAENKTIIDLSEKERGVYFIRIENEMLRIVLD